MKKVSKLSRDNLPALFLKRKFKWFRDICMKSDEDLVKQVMTERPDAFRPYMGILWKEAVEKASGDAEKWDEFVEARIEHLVSSIKSK